MVEIQNVNISRKGAAAISRFAIFKPTNDTEASYEARLWIHFLETFSFLGTGVHNVAGAANKFGCTKYQ